MVAEWTGTTLGRLLAFSNGKSSPTRSNRFSYRVYGSNGVIGFSEESNADPKHNSHWSSRNLLRISSLQRQFLLGDRQRHSSNRCWWK